MIVRLDHIGIVAPNIEQALGILDTKLGFPLASTTPLPDGAYFAPEGTHNYMFQVLVPVVPEAGTYKFLQRFGAGLHHWGYACDDVEEEAARLREQGLQQIELGGPDPGSVTAAFFHPKTAGGILTELVPLRPS